MHDDGVLQVFWFRLPSWNLTLAPVIQTVMEQSPLLAVDKPRSEQLAQASQVCEADPLLK